MKKLIITEKPSVARQFAQTLGVSGNHNGYIENDNYIITWCVGHLVTMSYPEVYDEKMKKWDLDLLPFLPEKYLYEVITNVKDQFNVVKKLFNRTDIDTIYNAGDSGREGEYIQRLVLQMAGYNKNAKLLRIWIDSQTDDAIKNGIRDAKPFSVYDKLSEAAYMRAIEDYAIGINFSRALTCKYGYYYNTKIKADKYKSLNIGRVMTCVLGMIVEREREIRNFVPTSFYKIEADAGFDSVWKAVESSYYYNSPLLYNETGFKEKTDANKLLFVMNKDKRLRVEQIEKKKEYRKAPLLFNLAELQSECSKRFKISPDKTLEIAQKLYEAKMITYPRTDARVISTAVCDCLGNTLNKISKNNTYRELVMPISQNHWNIKIHNTKYCDDSKITDHYAIIPTGELIDELQNLSELEREIYDLIMKRFVSIFYPPAEYSNVEATLLHASGEKFFCNCKCLDKKGYLEVTGVNSKDNEQLQQALSNLSEEQVLNCEFLIKEGSTKPPRRYDSGSMILAMENAGKLIEDEELRAQIKDCGIGTSATRAEIIKKLTKVGYIVLNSKTQVLTPHSDGEALYDIVKDTIPDILKPNATANWEKGLSQIEKGEITVEKYMAILNNYVQKNVEKIKMQDVESGKLSFKKKYGKCPSCGGELRQTKFGLGCCNYSDENIKCKFSIGKMIADKLTEKQIEKLSSNGKTDLIKGFKSKKGNDFSAYVVYDNKEKTVKLEFPEKNK